MKKILTTGGLGYIGSHTIVELCNKGYQPIIVDNLSNSVLSIKQNIEKIIGAEVPFYQVNCHDQQALEEVFEKEANIEGVIHFAALKAVGESVEKPLEYFDNNINSTIALIKCIQKYDVKHLIFSSSCSVYGNPDHLPVSEKTPFKPAESPYGYTKQVCEELIKNMHVTKRDFNSIILRYFNPVGAHHSALIGELPLSKPSSLVPVITKTAIKDKEFKKLTVFGDDYDTPDGSPIRDYIHVVDLAQAHIAAFEYSEKSQRENAPFVFNIGTGKGNTVLELIKAFEKITNAKLNYEIGARRAGDVVAIYSDTKKSIREMKWQPKYSIEDALKHAWEWEKYLQQHKKELLKNN